LRKWALLVIEPLHCVVVRDVDIGIHSEGGLAVRRVRDRVLKAGEEFVDVVAPSGLKDRLWRQDESFATAAVSPADEGLEVTPSLTGSRIRRVEYTRATFHELDGLLLIREE